MPDRLLTTREAAGMMGVAVGTLANMRARGEGPPFIKKGRYIRYWEPDIQAWADKDKVVPGGKPGDKPKDKP